MDSTLRPMSTSQVLDRTFSLYRQNFFLFAGIAVLPPALGLVGQGLILFMGQSAGNFMDNLNAVAGIVFGAIIFGVLYLLGAALATGATVYAVSRVHLGHAVTIGESYHTVQPLVLRIIGIIFRIGLMSGGAFLLGYLALIIPMVVLGSLARQAGGGVLFVALASLLGFGALVAASIWAVRIYCRYCLAVPACVVENAGVSQSLTRSKFLSKQSLGRIFLIYLLAGILGLVLSVVLSIPNYVALGLHPGKVQPMGLQLWSLVSGFLAGTLAGPIGTVATALVYYDNRVRKEALDLQLMMQAIGQQPPPTVITSSASLG